MSLIICPECRKSVSDQADICIHCGYPLKKIQNSEYIYTLHLVDRGDPKYMAKCVTSIRIYSKLGLKEAKAMYDSNKDEIVFSSNDTNEIEKATKEFEQWGCIVRTTNQEKSIADAEANKLRCPRCG